MMVALPPCAGAVLAGGRSSRMGDGPKAFAPLGGRPMIEHVISRLRPQVRELVLCVDDPGSALAALGYPLVTDVVLSHRGPLTGLCSALRHFQLENEIQWLLLAPCDAPFLPADLAGRLLRAAIDDGKRVAGARYGDHPQPTFSVWRLDTLPAVQEAVLQSGLGGLMRMLDVMPHSWVDWPAAEPPPFFNVNTPDDLVTAAGWLDPGGGKG
jgi:molybdopterin-guanine dinucleotide biosynthesis protein A